MKGSPPIDKSIAWGRVAEALPIFIGMAALSPVEEGGAAVAGVGAGVEALADATGLSSALAEGANDVADAAPGLLSRAGSFLRSAASKVGEEFDDMGRYAYARWHSLGGTEEMEECLKQFNNGNSAAGHAAPLGDVPGTGFWPTAAHLVAHAAPYAFAIGGCLKQLAGF
jgi:hypothetical protein